MKPARIFLWLAFVLLAFLAWWYWPATPALAPMANSRSTTMAVEPPKALPARPGDAAQPATLPTVANTGNATALDASRQETLDGLLKFQTALEQSLSTTTDPKDRDALEHELAQLQIQIQQDIGPSVTPPVVTTNLGEIALNEGRSVQRKLASGDVATFTASTTVDGNWSVNVIVRHTDASGATTDESTFIVVQPGQAAVVKATGNEIHIVLKLAAQMRTVP